MKSTNNSKNNAEKTNKDIKNNSLFTEMTAQEEAFVSGGLRILLKGRMVY